MDFAGLRIGLVGPIPPPSGGMANQTRQLAELLRSERAQVTLVATNPDYRPAWVSRFRGFRAGFRLWAYVQALWRATAGCDVLHLMANSGWSWHLFAVPAILVAQIRGVPVLVNYRGGGAGEFLARSALAVRWSMSRSARLVVPSAFLVEVFGRFGMTAEVVPNVVDLARFQRREPRLGDSAHLLVSRNLEALYDNATALRAFKQVRAELPNARLTIAGSGPEAQMLGDLARQLKIDDAVTFAGALDRDAMASLYRRADVMLNPSLADNLPNSLLESLASGVPLVSTRVGGVPYIVRDGQTGLLVPAGDANAMAIAALRILREPGLWQCLADAGFDEVQRYTWPRVGTRLAEVYRGVIGRQPH